MAITIFANLIVIINYLNLLKDLTKSLQKLFLMNLPKLFHAMCFLPNTVHAHIRKMHVHLRNMINKFYNFAFLKNKFKYSINYL